MNSREIRKVELIMKGMANHWRIKTMLLLQKESGLSVGDITEKLSGDYNNLSDHIRKLTLAGLVHKKYHGNEVAHTLTPRAKSILEFCKILK